MLYLNTDLLNRCLQTLALSLAMYEGAEEGGIAQEVFRNSIVKSYEFAQESALKLLKKALKVYGHSGKKLDSTPVKDILSLAAVHSLLSLEEVERWFIYRDNRNNTAHDYGEAFAKETLVLIPGFLEDCGHLSQVLEEKLGKATDA